MQLDHLLTRSILTRLAISLVVSLGFFYPFVCRFFFRILGNLVGELCLYVTTKFFFIPVSCTEISCLSNARHRGDKTKISLALHNLILNCFFFATETWLPTCVQRTMKLNRLLLFIPHAIKRSLLQF